MNVQIVLFDGFDLLDAIAPYEVFTKPMRLTLKFTVYIDGNKMFGEAKAGMLPASKLTGHRIS